MDKAVWEAVGRDTRDKAVIAKEYGMSKSNVYAIQKRYGLVWPYRPEDASYRVNEKSGLTDKTYSVLS